MVYRVEIRDFPYVPKGKNPTKQGNVCSSSLNEEGGKDNKLNRYDRDAGGLY